MEKFNIKSRTFSSIFEGRRGGRRSEKNKMWSWRYQHQSASYIFQTSPDREQMKLLFEDENGRGKMMENKNKSAWFLAFNQRELEYEKALAWNFLRWAALHDLLDKFRLIHSTTSALLILRRQPRRNSSASLCLRRSFKMTSSFSPKLKKTNMQMHKCYTTPTMSGWVIVVAIRFSI